MKLSKINTPVFTRNVKVEDSSNIEALFYDPMLLVLRVKFTATKGPGRMYEYTNVTRTQFGTLVAAESVGQAFNAMKIKDLPNKEIK